jgi:hypothetical protein
MSILLYVPLFLLHRGVIKPGTSWYQPKEDVVATNPEDDQEDLEHASQESGHPATGQGMPPENHSSKLLKSSDALSREGLRLWSTIL